LSSCLQPREHGWLKRMSADFDSAHGDFMMLPGVDSDSPQYQLFTIVRPEFKAFPLSASPGTKKPCFQALGRSGQHFVRLVSVTLDSFPPHLHLILYSSPAHSSQSALRKKRQPSFGCPICHPLLAQCRATVVLTTSSKDRIIYNFQASSHTASTS